MCRQLRPARRMAAYTLQPSRFTAKTALETTASTNLALKRKDLVALFRKTSESRPN